MNQEQFRKFVDDELTTIAELLESKNADYGGVEGDVLENIKMCEIIDICPSEQGILIRMTDKYKRLINLLKTKKDPQVKTETTTDTIRDLIGYLILLRAVQSERPNEKQSHSN